MVARRLGFPVRKQPCARVGVDTMVGVSTTDDPRHRDCARARPGSTGRCSSATWSPARCGSRLWRSSSPLAVPASVRSTSSRGSVFLAAAYARPALTRKQEVLALGRHPGSPRWRCGRCSSVSSRVPEHRVALPGRHSAWGCSSPRRATWPGRSSPWRSAAWAGAAGHPAVSAARRGTVVTSVTPVTLVTSAARQVAKPLAAPRHHGPSTDGGARVTSPTQSRSERQPTNTDSPARPARLAAGLIASVAAATAVALLPAVPADAAAVRQPHPSSPGRTAPRGRATRTARSCGTPSGRVTPRPGWRFATTPGPPSCSASTTSEREPRSTGGGSCGSRSCSPPYAQPAARPQDRQAREEEPSAQVPPAQERSARSSTPRHLRLVGGGTTR